MDQQLLNRIRQCDSLPTLPAVAVQVLELVRDPKSEIPQLARLVSKDAGAGFEDSQDREFLDLFTAP